MAEISLRVYQKNIDSILAQEGFGEVIAHCRHILRVHPKNVRAYNQMGRALFRGSSLEEATEIFNRLLGVLPNDFMAHSYLGEIYQRLGQHEDALWHTERAYDQQPNNGKIIERLRELYKEHRGQELQRLQLTAGAVAQQHIRNQLYQQAIDVLAKALQRYPSRVDLQLLRANASWEIQRYMDAAENAVEVLAVLPYALDANRILTELWLMEQRPSDAQRYLSRIEDLDPYFAHYLATGENPPDDTIIIEELDYAAISRHQMTTTDPDWLSSLEDTETVEAEPVSATPMTPSQAIENSEFDDSLEEEEGLVLHDTNDLGWLDHIDEKVASASQVTANIGNVLPAEWQERINALDEDDIDTGALDPNVEESPQQDEALPTTDELNLPEGMGTDDLSDDLLNRLSKMKGMSQSDTMPAMNRPNISPPSRTSTGLTGMLSQLDDDDDDLSWLADVQQGGFDEPVTDELGGDWDEGDTGELQQMPFAEEEDDLSFFDELDDVEEQVSAEPTAPAFSVNPDDPNAWLQASGIEFDENAEVEDLFAPEDDDVAFQSKEVNPMAWLDESAMTEEAIVELEPDPDEVDPTAWMREAGIDMVSETGDLPSDDVPGFFDDVEDEEPEAASEEDMWLGDEDMLDEMLSFETGDLDFDFDLDSPNLTSTLDSVGIPELDSADEVDDEAEGLFDAQAEANIEDELEALFDVDDVLDDDEFAVDDLFDEDDDPQMNVNDLFEDTEQIDDDDEFAVDDLFEDDEPSGVTLDWMADDENTDDDEFAVDDLFEDDEPSGVTLDWMADDENTDDDTDMNIEDLFDDDDETGVDMFGENDDDTKDDVFQRITLHLRIGRTP